MELDLVLELPLLAMQPVLNLELKLVLVLELENGTGSGTETSLGDGNGTGKCPYTLLGAFMWEHKSDINGHGQVNNCSR
jgi:hypothetical protein